MNSKIYPQKRLGAGRPLPVESVWPINKLTEPGLAKGCWLVEQTLPLPYLGAQAPRVVVMRSWDRERRQQL